MLEINNPGSNVTIKNVVLEGGNAQENGGLGFEGQSDALGGGILNLGGNVVLSNVVVRSNKATAGNNFSAQGGGIYSQDGSLTINHSVILNNTATDGGEDATYGGGVAFALPNNTTPQLTITNSTVANNRVSVQVTGPASGSGGGIAAQGNSKIVNSTIAGNTATNQGGGMFFEAGATGQLTNDTVSGNTANEGGGLDNNNGDVQTVTLVNTIVAGNTITNNTGVPDQDITAQFTSDGHNLIGIGNTWVNNGGGPGDLAGTAANPLNANLGPLQNNGGTTLTMGLLPGSPAIGKGDPGVLSITGQNDQRGPGFARQDNGVVDIGAYQFTQPTTGGGGGGGGSNGGGGGGTTQSPPSLFGAIFTLFLDGVYLEIDILEGGSLDLAPSPSASSANFFLEALDVFLGDPSNAALQDSINFNMPYAGPFGQFALLLGEIELMQAVPPQSL